MTKPIVLRQDGSIGPAGLRLVEQRAREGKTQRSIAAELGLPLKKFEKMLEANKGDNDVRLFWERGHAFIEQKCADALLAAGMGTEERTEREMLDENANPVLDEHGQPRMETVIEKTQSKIGGAQLMFYCKTRLGWTEKPTGPLVQDNRIQITIPASQTREELFEQLGIDGPLDFRKDKSKPNAMVDVTPKPDSPLGLPTPKKEDEKP